MRVLILGGYGTFGARLARLLARDGRLTLLIAGRSRIKAQLLCDSLDGAAERLPLVFDRDRDPAPLLDQARPQLVVDAAGPFQAYGEDPYRLARACIEAGANYLDLADAAEFVAGIGALDARAREKGLFALSGLSTFPALSHAVIEFLSRDLDAITAIRAGVAPSPRAGVGPNVVRAIASYAGKPLPVIAGGQTTSRLAIIDSTRRTIGVPGELPLNNTLFTLAETPDLKLAPGWAKAEGLRELWTGAGPRPELLHQMLRGLAWLVRLRLLPSLGGLSEVLHWGSRTFVWGEDRGGMFVEVEGEGADGPVSRAWDLVAEGDDGPFIPSIGAAAVIRRMAEGQKPAPGARSAAGAVSLADYEAVFETLHIKTGVWTEAPAGAPLYQRVLGPAWDRLAAPIRAMHQLSGEKVVSGEATVIRGKGPLAWLAGLVMGFPKAGEGVPVTVRFTDLRGGELWRRTFAGQSFQSFQEDGAGRSQGLVVELFGPIGIHMAVLEEGGRLVLAIRRVTLFGVPLPSWLRPGGVAYEHAEDGRFNFFVEMRAPLAGLIVGYRGWLVEVDDSAKPNVTDQPLETGAQPV